ncbi:MAG: ornithine carbamoyltransferase [Ilumatobacteraceae bacterium]|nr:ornithine carbamoyltransferase [Ilumatobacteraceae bacterium]
MTVTHLLNIADLGVGQINEILALSAQSVESLNAPLQGQGVALLFEKPSNRTRHSMEIAVVQLGGHPVYTMGEEVGLDVRESVEDVTKILCGYHAIVAARVFKHSFVERMAKVSTKPVINMLSDYSHPLQAFADALTMTQHVGALGDLTVAWVGDYNNVARSLTEIVLISGGRMQLGCPLGYNASPLEIERLKALGGSIEQFDNAQEAVAKAHVVHTDTWISMGQEEESSKRRKIFANFCVTEDLMSAASKGAKFMHCMPAHRDEEVSAGVFDGAASLAIEQGHNRLHSARGVMAYLKGAKQ